VYTLFPPLFIFSSSMKVIHEENINKGEKKGQKKRKREKKRGGIKNNKGTKEEKIIRKK
jgi:hypothetical protein